MSVFESLFTDAETSLDELFADPLEYRAAGWVIPFVGILASHRMGMNAERDVPTTWQEEVVEVPAAVLVDSDGQTFLPQASHEIARTMPDRSIKVYVVVNGPNGQPYESIDSAETRLAVYCKFLHVEAA